MPPRPPSSNIQLTDYITQLLGQVTALTSTMEIFKTKMFGNGQLGILDRMIKMEEDITQLCSTTAENAAAIAELNKSIAALAMMVKSHHEDKHLHSLIGLSGRKETIIWIMVAFTVFHSFVSSIPDLGVVFRFLFGLVGIKLP
jgi:uncharacterized coiled-coil protein SlyX